MWKTRTARPQYDAHRARRGGENGTVGARRERLWTPSRALFFAGVVNYTRARIGGSGSGLAAEAPSARGDAEDLAHAMTSSARCDG